MSRFGDEPTEPLGTGGADSTEPLETGGDQPTESLPPDGEEPTETLPPETGQTEEMRTRRLAEHGPGPVPPPAPPVPPTETRPTAGPADESRRRGIWFLAASIVAAVALVAIYIAAGGLDYKPAGAADPCDARPWTDPGNLEETAQQFALSAIDGAACQLGVSREELTRALADEDSRNAFAEQHGLSEQEIEDAIRAGLNRAIDDAENAGALNSLVATGLRAAVKIMPVTEMIPLIEDASEIFGDGSSGLGGLIDGVVDAFGGGSGDSGDSGSDSGPLDGLGDSIPRDLPDRLQDELPEDLRRNLPDDLDRRIEQGLERGLDGLLNP